jgi:hypothetical protein
LGAQDPRLDAGSNVTRRIRKGVGGCQKKQDMGVRANIEGNAEGGKGSIGETSTDNEQQGRVLQAYIVPQIQNCPRGKIVEAYRSLNPDILLLQDSRTVDQSRLKRS